MQFKLFSTGSVEFQPLAVIILLEVKKALRLRVEVKNIAGEYFIGFLQDQGMRGNNIRHLFDIPMVIFKRDLFTHRQTHISGR